tara:strand:+ start:999 stop:1358 length:360 start_codon:yes stop_codon:yes gene_type:complete
MNNVHKGKSLMNERIVSLTTIMCLLVTPAFSDSSRQHSANAVGHSGQASSEGSAAVLSGAAVIASVPIMTAGSVLVITGAGLQIVSQDILLLDDELNRAASGQIATTQGAQPNGLQTLD